MTSGQFHLPRDQLFITHYQFHMTSNEFNVNSDQFLMTLLDIFSSI